MQYFGSVPQEEYEEYLRKTAEEKYKIIEESVRCYTPGRAFRLGNFGLRDRHMPKLIELLNQNPAIDNLWLDFNNIGNKGILLLAQGLKYIKQLSLYSTNICNDPQTTDETLIALAQSNITHLIITGTTITKKNVDLFLTHSRQTKLDLGDNEEVDQESKERAKQKANENSAALLRATLMGNSPTKRLKKDSDSEQTISPEKPDDNAAVRK